MRLFFLFISLISVSLLGQDTLPEIEIPALVPEESGRFMGEFIKIMLVVGAMVAALLFLSWSSKKMIHSRIQQVNENSELKIIETRSVSTRTTIYQLEFEGRSILFAESTNGVTLLQSIPKRDSFNFKET